MASIAKYKVGGYECCKLTDTSTGKRLQYAVKLDKFTEKQWLAAHNSVINCLSPHERHEIESKRLKELVAGWLAAPKETKANAKITGIKSQAIEAKSETSIKKVAESLLADFCRPEINSQNAISKAQSQCSKVLEFLKESGIIHYSHLKRDVIAKYPEWRGKAAADTVNQELRRLGAIIRHGIKYHGWQERYLLDGIRVKQTQDNTKTVRPFEMPEAKAILGWLRANAGATGNWYLHDMALLAVCAGLEAKALSLLKKEWFKLDLGILRVYDKLVSGVLDAKTQNRARDIPLTPTLRKICERGFVFERPQKKKGRAARSPTWIHSYSRRAFASCERDTGIKDVDWHRFRHTCATMRLSAGWQLVRVSRMLGHSGIGTTAKHYAEYDLSASPEGFEGMVKVYGEFVEWLDEGYF